MKFVIFHGSFVKPPWRNYLKEELEKLGQKVITPELPLDTWERVSQLGESHPSEIQTLESWTKTFEEVVLPEIKEDEQLCFIGHSLGPLFILHMVNKHNIQLDSGIFIAPFLEKLDTLWEINVVNHSFYKSDFDFAKLQKLIPVSYAIYSDNDPYVINDRTANFADRMNCSRIEVKNGKHFNKEAGYMKFPLLLELCKTRLGII